MVDGLIGERDIQRQMKVHGKTVSFPLLEKDRLREHRPMAEGSAVSYGTVDQ